MKQIALLLISIILLINQQACNSRQQTDSQPTDSTATAAASTTPDEATVTGRLTELNLTPNSDWRGISLGDDFAEVKTTEKGESFENDATHTGYTVEFKNLETMDVLYYQTAGKVSAIDVDLYLNNRQSVTDYQKELDPYFTARYGSSKSGNGGTTWTSSNGKTVMLKDVSKGKDFGLKIKIGPSEKVIQ